LHWLESMPERLSKLGAHDQTHPVTIALKRGVIEAFVTLGLHDRVDDLARSELVDIGLRLQNRASVEASGLCS
jgi:hypothetical protein